MVVHRLTQLAFASHARLDPPSGATSETQQQVRTDLETYGGALASIGSQPVACLRFDRQPDHFHVRRVAVEPRHQGHGIGRAMMEWIHAYARREGFHEVRVGVRIALPGNRQFYEGLGYSPLRQHTHPGYSSPTWEEFRLSLR
jgi:tRNA threonylcarbamoyladenosine biosynthesis protein TsaE